MSKLEERLRSDFLYYESLGNDKERFPTYANRYEFEQVAKYIKYVLDKFEFVNDVNNEENVPDVYKGWQEEDVDELDKVGIDVTSSQ